MNAKKVFDPLRGTHGGCGSKKGEVKAAKKEKAGPIEDRLKNRIIDGDKVGLNAELDEGLKSYKPLEIIKILFSLTGEVVGELFGSVRCSYRSCCNRRR